MKTQLEVVIERISADVKAIERELREGPVVDQLTRKYRDEEVTEERDGHTWKRSITYEEAETRATTEVNAMSDSELEEAFDQHYDDWSAYADSESWEHRDHEEGRIAGYLKAAEYAQAVIDHGIHAFDPNHPRNREETAQ